MRKTDEKIRRRTLELWLEGYTYRDIHSKLEISLGTISPIIDNVRKKAPDLDGLRRLNLAIRKQDSSIQDALRGSCLLEKVNQLGISLDRLEILLKIISKIASERHTGEKNRKRIPQTDETRDSIQEDLRGDYPGFQGETNPD